MSAALVLIDLDSQASFEFQFFPMSVKTTVKPNWEKQETTIGPKPLFYKNREPKSLNFPELYFDTTDTGESLKEKLEALEEFTTKESDTDGMPPALLAAWGDRSLRCVLEDLQIEEIYFTNDGNPTRARLSIMLTELQAEGETTTVTVTDDNVI